MARACAIGHCGWSALLGLGGTRNWARDDVTARSAAHWHAPDGGDLRDSDCAGVARIAVATEGTRLAPLSLDDPWSDQVDPGRFRPGAVGDLVCLAFCLWRGTHRAPAPAPAR